MGMQCDQGALTNLVNTRLVEDLFACSSLFLHIKSANQPVPLDSPLPKPTPLPDADHEGIWNDVRKSSDRVIPSAS